jgi:Big-like domain-containing protein
VHERETHLKNHLPRVGALVGAAAVLIASLVVTATPAQAAPGDGTIVVNVVDQYGRPTVGILNAMAPDGTAFYDAPAGSPVVSAPTHVFTLPPGGYAFTSLTPWGGVTCAGIPTCYAGGAPPSGITPVVTAVADATTTYTIQVVVPTITGSGAVGSPLSVQVPEGLKTLQNALAAYGGGAAIGTQWLRGATDIAGATSTSYVTAPSDGAQAVAARLTPSNGQAFYFAQYGAPVQPFVTNAIPVSKYTPAKTKTKLTVARSLGVGERASLKVKVTSKAGKPEGLVTITIGKFKTQKTLKDGSVFITIPRLAAGVYKISTKYAGSDYFAKSKGKVTVTVHD